MKYNSSSFFCLNIRILVLERNCTGCVEEFVEAGMCVICTDVVECFALLPCGCNHCKNESGREFVLIFLINISSLNITSISYVNIASQYILLILPVSIA